MKTYERKQYNGIGQKKTARIKKKTVTLYQDDVQNILYYSINVKGKELKI